MKKCKLIQKKNLKREMDEFIMNPDFTSQDVFKKHSEFISQILTNQCHLIQLERYGEK